jgi:hypothetical protein
MHSCSFVIDFVVNLKDYRSIITGKIKKLGDSLFLCSFVVFRRLIVFSEVLLYFVVLSHCFSKVLLLYFIVFSKTSLSLGSFVVFQKPYYASLFFDRFIVFSEASLRFIALSKALFFQQPYCIFSRFIVSMGLHRFL